MSQQDQQERRGEERMRIATPVLFTVEDHLHLQSSYDISASGMAISCPFEPPVGTTIQLRFTHPRVGGYVSAEGIVVHSTLPNPSYSQHRIGVKFSKVTRPVATNRTVN